MLNRVGKNYGPYSIGLLKIRFMLNWIPTGIINSFKFIYYVGILKFVLSIVNYIRLNSE